MHATVHFKGTSLPYSIHVLSFDYDKFVLAHLAMLQLAIAKHARALSLA